MIKTLRNCGVQKKEVDQTLEILSMFKNDKNIIKSNNKTRYKSVIKTNQNEYINNIKQEHKKH